MAQRFYPTNFSGVPFIPATQGSWSTTIGQNRRMYAHKEQAAEVETGAGFEQAFSETSATSPFDNGRFKFVGPELAAQEISGTFNMVWGVRSTQSTALAVYKAHIYVVTPTNTVRGTLLSNHAEPDDVAAHFPVHSSNEFNHPMVASAALTPVTCVLGDRIVIEWGVRTYNTTTTTASGAYVWSYNDATLIDRPADGSTTMGWSWFEFSQDIAFPPNALQVSQMRTEVVLNPAAPMMRTSHMYAEAITNPAAPMMQTSQVYVEIITSPFEIPTEFHRTSIIITS